MPYNIVVDAGHGGSDSGAQYGGRKEKDDNLKLALAVGNILEKNGVDVSYTRTTDVYQTPFQKAQIANNSDADFFVSIHRNSGPTPNKNSGVQSLIYDDSGIKAKMARNISSQLEKVGYKNLGIDIRPRLVVLRRTKMPSVLVEAGFINSDADNKRYVNQFNQTAQAIADGILMTLDKTAAQSIKQLYRVQVGAYRDQNAAQRLVAQLQREGYPAFIVLNNGLYRVQVGAFNVLDNAGIMEQRLRTAGYNTFVSTQ